MGNIKKRTRSLAKSGLQNASGGDAELLSRIKGGTIKKIKEVARHYKSSKHKPGRIALFEGPSGTGKTMAAEYLAANIGSKFYRIDLSAVVNKYIGETEKNLARVFETAGANEGILFFDEADALLGKRTDIKDSHDRHTNIDVNFLLQRIEEYSGLVILTTNNKKQLDEALLRRVRFVVEFSS